MVVDQGQFCFKPAFVQHGIGIHRGFQRCIWELSAVLWEQVTLQQSSTDEMLGERKPLLGMADNGATDL